MRPSRDGTPLGARGYLLLFAAAAGCGPTTEVDTCANSPQDRACDASEVCQTDRCLWNDPTLTSLEVSPGSLTFRATQSYYEVVVPLGASTVQLTPVLPQPGRVTLTINGSAASTQAPTEVPLPGAATSIDVVVLAESGASRAYRLEVFKGAAVQRTYLKGTNTEAGDFSGFPVALSADGNTLAIGARGEASHSGGVNGGQADDSAPESGAVYVLVREDGAWVQQAYLKAAFPDSKDWFGRSLALSADGNTLAVGAQQESSKATGVNGDPTDNSASRSGAVYVFARASGTWSQQAYLKASNSEGGDMFGYAVALSGDGLTLAVGSALESSNATGVNGDPSDNSAWGAGAVYVFAQSQGAWAQQAYLKASNTQGSDGFGIAVALSSSGELLAVGAPWEDSNATGTDGSQADNSAVDSGAVYLFARAGGAWAQQAYLKASNTGAGDHFGSALALASDGTTLAVGAPWEDSSATGVDGNQSDNSASRAGAVYLFTRPTGVWAQESYLKAANTDAGDELGYVVALSADGQTLLVGADTESGGARGVNGDASDNSAAEAGAAYLFARSAGTWAQQAYLKASNADAKDGFGSSVALAADGRTLAVGAPFEASSAEGVNGDQTDNSAPQSGAVYLFAR